MNNTKYQIFNNQKLIAFTEINGKRIELIELNETRLEPVYEKTPIRVIGSRATQYKTSYIGLEGRAKIINISYKGQDIINHTGENLQFMLYKDGITLYCCIEDVDSIIEDEYVYFTARE